jgi:mRNA interferase RelE/StbE
VKVVLAARAAKYLGKISEPAKSRLKAALTNLSRKPMLGDMKKLKGRDGFRLRVGGYRILFFLEHDTVVVSNIAPRGEAYKE